MTQPQPHQRAPIFCNTCRTAQMTVSSTLSLNRPGRPWWIMLSTGSQPPSFSTRRKGVSHHPQSRPLEGAS